MGRSETVCSVVLGMARLRSFLHYDQCFLGWKSGSFVAAGLGAGCPGVDDGSGRDIGKGFDLFVICIGGKAIVVSHQRDG